MSFIDGAICVIKDGLKYLYSESEGDNLYIVIKAFLSLSLGLDFKFL